MAHKRLDSGHHRPRMGTNVVARLTHAGFSIQIAAQQSGITIKRTSYSAALYRPVPYRHEFLSGYTNLAKAKAAARARADELYCPQRASWRS